ncbi:MAG TPA: DUF3551 domain-containing protein [Burkholderiales bacterium]|jgi:Protein of unknown function (DUF3551)|nr:DUF3551 domain-containing protein [Burkholderiales bacterium]
MRNLAFTILTVGIALAAGPARAQTYDPGVPVCMTVVASRGGTHVDCSYYTLGQCQASAAGRGASCYHNPYYAAVPASSRRHVRRYRQAGSISPGVADSYCLQGRHWGYPGNCQFSSYDQCMATASGTHAYCGINPQAAYARQRRGAYPGRY